MIAALLLLALLRHEEALGAMRAPYVGGGESDASCGYAGAPCDSPGPITRPEILAVMRALAARLSEYRPQRSTDGDLADAIIEAASSTGIDWRDLLIIGWYESRWTTRATAPDGCACGAWQVRSSRCIEGRPACEDLYNAHVGAMHATRILRSCCGLISCYAAGPAGHTRRWAQNYARRHAETRRMIP